MTVLEEKLVAESVRKIPILYDVLQVALENVAKQIKPHSGMYYSIEYSFICLMFSLVRVTLLYGCSFLGFFRLNINYRSILSAERFLK